eukprot:1180020-Prorocentrum_minimum.AAC.1
MVFEVIGNNVSSRPARVCRRTTPPYTDAMYMRGALLAVPHACVDEKGTHRVRAPDGGAGASAGPRHHVHVPRPGLPDGGLDGPPPRLLRHHLWALHPGAALQGSNRSAGMGIYPAREPIAVYTWAYTWSSDKSTKERHTRLHPNPAFGPSNLRVQGANRSAGMGIYPAQEPITVQTWVYTWSSDRSTKERHTRLRPNPVLGPSRLAGAAQELSWRTTILFFTGPLHPKIK